VEAFIAEELEKNPLLDTAGLDSPASDAADAPGEAPGEPDGGEKAPAADAPADGGYSEDNSPLGGPGMDGGLGMTGGGGGGLADRDDPSFEATLAGRLSLADHLMA